MVAIQVEDCRFEAIRAVVFDKDGTLARSESFLSRLAHHRAQLIHAQVPVAQVELLRAFGIEAGQINPAGLMAVGTRLENEMAAAAYIAATGKGWVEACDLARSLFQAADPVTAKAEQTPLISGSLELIQQLTQAQVRLAILSSDSQTQVEAFVRQYNLEPYFQVALGVDWQHPHKADPELLQTLFTQLAVTPTQTLMIGDSQLDVLVARQAGMAGCIGFSGGWTLPSPQLTADVVIDRLGKIELLSIL
ncbi:MAG: HAD family hydrolase [Elainella sp.]